jgi:hypothetical protein
MIGAGALQMVAVADIELDKFNPRIRKFLEMYGGDPTPEQFYLALGAGGDEEGGATSTTFEKLKNSIIMNGGVIQPVMLNKLKDGSLICIDGNTRVALYKNFISEKIKGNWANIPALVYNNLDENGVDAVRLQVHLVGPRQWDPYSKAKYLHHLRAQEHLPFSTIVDFCGGRQKEIVESINAFTDMETHYRAVIEDEGDFDTKKFSGFVELQKPGVKEALLKHGFSLNDFAEWIYSEKLYPLNTVRVLPRILQNPTTRDIFLKHGARKAEAALAKPDLSKALGDADMGQLAQALASAIRALPFSEHQRLKADPGGQTSQALAEVTQELESLTASLNSDV